MKSTEILDSLTGPGQGLKNWFVSDRLNFKREIGRKNNPTQAIKP